MRADRRVALLNETSDKDAQPVPWLARERSCSLPQGSTMHLKHN